VEPALPGGLRRERCAPAARPFLDDEPATTGSSDSEHRQ